MKESKVVECVNAAWVPIRCRVLSHFYMQVACKDYAACAGHLLDVALDVSNILPNGLSLIVADWHKARGIFPEREADLDSLVMATLSRLVAEPELINPVVDEVVEPIPTSWLRQVYLNIWTVFCKSQVSGPSLRFLMLQHLLVTLLSMFMASVLCMLEVLVPNHHLQHA